jgi:hypothetical protein
MSWEPRFYNLDDAGEPVPVSGVLDWRSPCDPRRAVANSEVGSARVSTVFLGLDHNFCGKGPPVLWETMVFGGKHDGVQERYTTRDAAEIGHQQIVELVTNDG